MLSLEDLRFFSMVASLPTLAAAARALDVTPPAVSQRLRQLETRLRVHLVDRSTRRLTLTGEGELLAQRGRYVLGEMDDITETLAIRRGTVGGHLRVATSFGFGRRFVAPIVGRFRHEHPETTVTLIVSDNPLRQGGDSWDILIHLGELRDSTLVAQHLAPNERVACASPDYLLARGVPTRPDDLYQHDCIALRENDEDVTLWRFTAADQQNASVRIEPLMASNDGDIVHSWALAGMGVVVRSEWDVADDLRAGRLTRVLPEWQLPAANVTALLGERRQRRAARTNRFLEFLRAAFAVPPWRE
jgi:DNA-binding transcriptional LysR family regulator